MQMRKILSLLFVCLFVTSSAEITLSPRIEKVFEDLAQGNVDQAIKQLKTAAATNDVTAQYYMGYCYEHGIGVDADAKLAFNMYRRAAERGFAPAMEQLARCYGMGIGIEANATRADDWQKRYTARHDGSTMPDIGEAYRTAVSQQANQTGSVMPKTQTLRQNTKNSAATTARVTEKPTQSAGVKATVQTPGQPAPKAQKSDVDIRIPATHVVADNVFALIIANENYQDVAKVSNAINDGEIFALYCRNTLGLPATNVHLIKDATLNNIKREVNLLGQIARAYDGKASFILYYAGHGVPDESTRNAYLMPVDGYVADLTTCYSLDNLYATLGNMPSAKTVVLLDACFSGATRGDGMLASARGVAIKPKGSTPKGNTVVLTSAQGDETAYPYDEQGHGMFTYFLLKKIKETGGNVTLGTLIDYVSNNVKRKSLVINGKEQTPTVVQSDALTSDWKNWKLN